MFSEGVQQFLFDVEFFSFLCGEARGGPIWRQRLETKSIRISWISHRIIKLCYTTASNTIEEFLLLFLLVIPSFIIHHVFNSDVVCIVLIFFSLCIRVFNSQLDARLLLLAIWTFELLYVEERSDWWFLFFYYSGDSSVFIGYWWGGWEVKAVGVLRKQRRGKGGVRFCVPVAHVRGAGVKYI